MPSTFVFRCPSMDLDVHGWLAEGPPADEKLYLAMECIHCRQVHLLNAKTGKVVTAAPPLICRECGTPMPDAHYRRQLCDGCRKARLAKRTAANAAKQLAERQAKRAGATCRHCRKSLQATRAHQVFCTDACRRARHRACLAYARATGRLAPD
jgi:hypothetical protein